MNRNPPLTKITISYCISNSLTSQRRGLCHLSKAKARDRGSPRPSGREAGISTEIHSEFVHFTDLVSLLWHWHPCSWRMNWYFFTVSTLALAAVGILGVDGNMDGWLKRSFNPASNELIWNKPLLNYHLVMIDSSPALMLLFNKQKWTAEFENCIIFSKNRAALILCQLLPDSFSFLYSLYVCSHTCMNM